MKESLYITSVCTINQDKLELNGEVLFRPEPGMDPKEILKSIFKFGEINYPKFYKMDPLCKLGLLCSEFLLKGSGLKERYEGTNIALIIANSHSSLESDREHDQSIHDRSNYFPSPAVFVYTLPNIVIGEIAIRNQLKGENTFFIFDKFEVDFMIDYLQQLMAEKTSDAVICGWVDYYKNEFLATLFTVERFPNGTAKELEHNNVTHLF